MVGADLIRALHSAYLATHYLSAFTYNVLPPAALLVSLTMLMPRAKSIAGFPRPAMTHWRPDSWAGAAYVKQLRLRHVWSSSACPTAEAPAGC